MKASRYLRVSLTKARCDWCMETSCITSTGTGKEMLKRSIACGVGEYNKWVQQPDNVSQQNKDDKMVPYLKRHFIYINYAKEWENHQIFHRVYCNLLETQFLTKKEFTEDGRLDFMETRVL
jgi:hypothetical protein